ncbi:hypothetical protein LguiB_024218 [Lonicera macranthoides]
MTFSSSIFLLLSIAFIFSTANSTTISNSTSHESPPCPLNFEILRKLVKKSSNRPKFINTQKYCQFNFEAIRIVRSEYLRTHNYFLPPSTSYESCWNSFRSFDLIPHFDIQSSCGYHPEWIFDSCINVRSKFEFENLIPKSKLSEIRRFCNKSLKDSSRCATCREKLFGLRGFFNGLENFENVSGCVGYLLIYAAGSINRFGPSDVATGRCLFSLELTQQSDRKKNHHLVAISGAVMGSVAGILGAFLAVWVLRMLNKNVKKGKSEEKSTEIETSFVSELGYNFGTSLVKYKYEEIKKATSKFSRENIIGNGNYGNVYKGVLENGSQVAIKRFKNCSIGGDGTFAHEVEVIASVKHVNLVSILGYCSATVPLEGHQRIIVCDLVQNGSLYHHLFSPETKRLSWPVRLKIALGMARGLAYLHNGVQPAIIHRDVKASNILIDENFEPKLADFGLAKFNTTGASHLSTKLAGTLGYVAPEYAMYGKLTEGSDVYSFGVVLLELLSGKKAIISMDEIKTCLLTDWAWSLVSKGSALDVIEENMSEVGPAELMEQYVFVAVLCCHSNLLARPTMDEIVKLLENQFHVVDSVKMS